MNRTFIVVETTNVSKEEQKELQEYLKLNSWSFAIRKQRIEWLK